MAATVLVTGGAGYIGSHAAKALKNAGFTVLALDNYSRGWREAVKWGEAVEMDLSDRAGLRELFQLRKIDAVMHFAAYAYVGESVGYPALYYRNNVSNTENLLEAVVAGGSPPLVFSSSCATYGEPREIPITESHPQEPVNPYGRTKLIVERMLADFETAYGLRHVALRYFNAAGADPEGEAGERHAPETHLIPLAIHAALGKIAQLEIFGDDYPTPDGTCIRDYVHVTDLATAHVLALQKLLDGGGSRSYNLGNGTGHSVREVVAEIERVSGREVPVRVGPRRPGDPAALVGSSALIGAELGWKPEFPGLKGIAETAWNWHLRSGA